MLATTPRVLLCETDKQKVQGMVQELHYLPSSYSPLNFFYFTPCEFFTLPFIRVSLLKLEWQQVSAVIQDFLIIPVDFNKAVVWMIPNLLLISSSSFFPSSPTTIGINVNLIFYFFYNSQAISKQGFFLQFLNVIFSDSWLINTIYTMDWIGFVSSNKNHRRLFNGKSCLYIRF